MAKEYPRYLHDCDNCTFLGNHVHHGEVQDLYYCTKPHLDSVSFIARESSEPSENASYTTTKGDWRENRIIGRWREKGDDCMILYGWGTTHAFLRYIYLTEGMEGINKLYINQ